MKNTPVDEKKKEECNKDITGSTFLQAAIIFIDPWCWNQFDNESHFQLVILSESVVEVTAYDMNWI